jgi:uncharacterized damage-inducible protein DinB
MNPSLQFVKRLEEIYSGEPWFGESILTKLKDVAEVSAFKQPKAGEHSIAELVAHMIFWRRAALQKITGNDAAAFSMQSPDNWPALESLKKMGWKKLTESLRETQESLVSELHKNAPLSDEVSAQINGTIEHDIYHLGQIAIVKKLVA